MGRIRITHDPLGLYEDGSVVETKDLIESYCEQSNDESICGWLNRIPVASAVAFVCEAWELDYEWY